MKFKKYTSRLKAKYIAKKRVPSDKSSLNKMIKNEIQAYVKKQQGAEKSLIKESSLYKASLLAIEQPKERDRFATIKNRGMSSVFRGALKFLFS